MDATCAIQASIHVFSLVRKYVSRILGTYQCSEGIFFSLYRKSHRSSYKAKSAPRGSHCGGTEFVASRPDAGGESCAAGFYFLEVRLR